MALKASFEKKTFVFKQASGTSRGVLTEKHAWYLNIWHSEAPEIVGLGECSIIPGLSPDFESFEQYEAKLNDLLADLTIELSEFPSIKFGLECALLDLNNGGKRIYFDNDFTRGIRKLDINGLIWMGDRSFMETQIAEKLAAGFRTIKMKIGAIDFETEFALLKAIREQHPANEITLRVDANGAFSPEIARERLKQLATLDIHSIEQPIRAGQWEALRELCATTPLPIALDEEMIGVHTTEDKIALLDTISPQYIVLKPSLHGGISGTQEWIALAEERDIPWWMTSALESNVGLEAISQLAGNYENGLPQGLGTGSLYETNSPTQLRIDDGGIGYDR